MEEGSLLQEALNDRREDELENALLVDVYLLQRQVASVEDHLLALAETGVALNEFLQSLSYPWLQGGDGPVFGVHVETSPNGGIPHLRACCRYGVSVADEWMLIGYVMQFTKDRDNLAVECWDVDDGQVLLIQSAEVLPGWVDTVGPAACRHRCWIRSGQVLLLEPAESSMSASQPSGDTTFSLSLSEALKQLKQDSLVTTPPEVNQVISETVQRIQSAPHYQRTALAVPRSVAGLLKHRPDLIAVAANAFVQSTQPGPVASSSTLPSSLDDSLCGTCEDWVWTTSRLGRVTYSMLRTIAAAPLWTSNDSIPPPYSKSLEVKRLRRQGSTEATPHLKHALPLGVRLVAGLDLLLSKEQQSKASSTGSTVGERRVLANWSRVSGEVAPDTDWLNQAWTAGPNGSAYNLESILKCPVYTEEVMNAVTPLSHPETSVAAQIRHELLKSSRSEQEFAVPGPQDVDDEVWMTLPDKDEDLGRRIASSTLNVPRPDEDVSTSIQKEETKVLDDMLGGMKSFMGGTSDVEGVGNTASSKMEVDAMEVEDCDPVRINPTVFLNILHAVLHAKSPEEIVLPSAATPDENYLFFSREDYDLMEPAMDDGMEDDANAGMDEEMSSLMTAMDQELLNKGRNLDIGQDETVPMEDDQVAEETHLVSNLLQSLEAGGGAPGPVRTVMTNLGVAPPQLAPSGEDDDDEK